MVGAIAARRDRRACSRGAASRSAPACCSAWSPSPAVAAVLRPRAGPARRRPRPRHRRDRRRRPLVARPAVRRPRPPRQPRHAADGRGRPSATAACSSRPARSPWPRRRWAAVGRLITGLRADPSDVTLPAATDAGPGVPEGAGRARSRAISLVPDAQRRLLPDRHPAQPAHARRRGLRAGHRRRRRERDDPQLRGPHRHGPRSSATSPSPACPTTSAAPTWAAPAGSASGSPTCSTWPASAARPTRSSPPTSTA